MLTYLPEWAQGALWLYSCVKAPEGHRNSPAFWGLAVTESVHGSRDLHGAQMSGRKLSVFAQLQKWGLKKGWGAHRKSPSLPGHQDSVWSFHNLAVHDSRYSNMADSYRHFPNRTVLLKRKKAQERLNKWINLTSWLLKTKIFTEPPRQAHGRQQCHLTGTCHTGAACPRPKPCGVCGNLKKLLLQSVAF